MKFNPAIHHRRSIRLEGYDYSQAGAYFITIVSQARDCLFGEILSGDMQCNAAGESLTSWWQCLPGKFPSTTADTFVVMPNHLHGIITITAKDGLVGADLRVRPDQDDVRFYPRLRPNALIPQIMQWYKTMTTNAYIHGVKEWGWPPFRGRLWQRNYYEHVIRDVQDHQRIYDYIEANPGRWTEDEENPATA